jgi:biopolymer transport protein ExbD
VYSARSLSKLEDIMPPSTLTKAGVLALLIAFTVSLGTTHWLNTRTFVPVNIPVSLEAGQLHSGPFNINLRADFWVSLDLDDSADDWTPGKCSVDNLPPLKWTLYRLHKQSAELWAVPDPSWIRRQSLDGFHAVPGTYRLDLDIPRSTVCLNARHPHLRISTSSGNQQEICGLVQYVCLFLGGTGVMLLLRALYFRLLPGVSTSTLPKIFPEQTAHNVLPLQRHRPLPLLHDLPNFGLICGLLFFVVFFVFTTVTPRTPAGLFISLGRSQWATAPESPWPTSLSVYITAQKDFLVNGRPVPRDKLRSELQEKLARSMVWTVYLEADSNTSFGDTVYLIDTIQGLGAKAVWITPKVRQDWCSSSGSYPVCPQALPVTRK